MSKAVCAKCGFEQCAIDEKGNAVCPVCGGEEFVQAPPVERWFCYDCCKWSETPVMIIDAFNGIHYDGCRGWD